MAKKRKRNVVNFIKKRKFVVFPRCADLKGKNREIEYHSIACSPSGMREHSVEFIYEIFVSLEKYFVKSIS